DLSDVIYRIDSTERAGTLHDRCEREGPPPFQLLANPGGGLAYSPLSKNFPTQKFQNLALVRYAWAGNESSGSTMSSPKPWPYTLAETYLRYRQRDGERVLFPDVEAKYGDVAADTITYDVLRKWASEFFPKLNKDEREILFVWSMAEILGWRQAEPRSQVAAEDKDPYPYDWAEIDYYGEVIYRDRGGRHWASISKAPGPPPDPGPR